MFTAQGSGQRMDFRLCALLFSSEWGRGAVVEELLRYFYEVSVLYQTRAKQGLKQAN